MRATAVRADQPTLATAAAHGPRYGAALEALRSRGRFGVRLGLGRTRALLARLGDPHLGLRGVLIGGTNGKGSAQALVASALAAAGVRVGQTPKPHLVSYRERIVVGGDPIAEGDFAGLVEEVIRAADGIERRHGAPTEFELLTAAAFTWFARCQVEVGVVEVGMGGRLDATNVWDGGVAAITNVGLDHMEHLGATEREIAREKAAIIKRGDLAVTGADGDALAVIQRRAARLGVPLTVVQPLVVERMDRSGLWLADPALGSLHVALLGRHQAANAATALAVLESLREAGIAAVPASAVRSGFASARWPGRLELLRLDETGRAWPTDGAVNEVSDSDQRVVDLVLDGAHNAPGVAALTTALDELRPQLSPGRPTLLLGVLRDKQVEEMLDLLAASTALRDARLVATSVPDSPRSLEPEALAAGWRARDRTSVAVIGLADRARDEAVRCAIEASGPLVVAGSLYLVGHVRGRLVRSGEPAEPD